MYADQVRCCMMLGPAPVEWPDARTVTGNQQRTMLVIAKQVPFVCAVAMGYALCCGGAWQT